jgi:hypothetical protein
MAAFTGLLWSLLFLTIAAGALARIVGWRTLEQLASKVAVAILLTLFVLPLAEHEVGAARRAVDSHTGGCSAPEVVVIRPEHGVAAGLVVLGHVALGLWWLRRRARRDDRGREVAEHDANRRRSRTRLPPRSEDGASPS